jgi:hypothetical protein
LSREQNRAKKRRFGQDPGTLYRLSELPSDSEISDPLGDASYRGLNETEGVIQVNRTHYSEQFVIGIELRETAIAGAVPTTGLSCDICSPIQST